MWNVSLSWKFQLNFQLNFHSTLGEKKRMIFFDTNLVISKRDEDERIGFFSPSIQLVAWRWSKSVDSTATVGCVLKKSTNWTTEFGQKNSSSPPPLITQWTKQTVKKLIQGMSVIRMNLWERRKKRWDAGLGVKSMNNGWTQIHFTTIKSCFM